jgi:uncharacterized membrane protein
MPFPFRRKANTLTIRTERTVLERFHVAVFLKGTYAAFETLVGLVLFIVPLSTIVSIVNKMAESELLEDPNDQISNYLLHAAQQLSISTVAFYALYLTLNGGLKLILVIGLLTNRSWAYPASVVIFGSFALYEIFLFATHPSLVVAILLILDTITILFIWKEYVIQKKHHHLDKVVA